MNCQRYILKIAAWIPAAIWYRFIWGFSAQPATVSGGVSDSLLEQLLEVISPTYAQASPMVQTAAVEGLSFFERKAAHMFLYFVLFLLLALALYLVQRKIWRRITAAGVACLLLAALDEYHQTFVPGRSGEPRDVAVDMAGALCALGIWLLLRWICKIRTDPRRRLHPAAAFLPAVVGMLAVIAVPPLIGASDGLLTALCTRFWETWPTLTELEQISVVSALSPVVTEILHIGLSGVLGCLALLTFAFWRRSLAMAFFAAMTGSAVWAGATALLLPTQAAVEAVCMAGAGAAFGCGIWIICLLVKRLCGQGKFI